MTAVRNVLAMIGAATLALLLLGGARVADFGERLRDLDRKARSVYGEMARILEETGSAAQAAVWKRPVEEGLAPEDVEQAMKSAAIERNILDVGELPLYRQVEASSGEPYRFVKSYMFYNALTAKRMIDYDPAFSAFLPCRITLLEELDGRSWLYTLNMDVMIHGGKPLPPELHDEAVRVRDTILAIMDRGAAGAFR